MVIVWATAIALGRMPRLNAATRHAIWWFALGAVLVLPLVQPDALVRLSATVPTGPQPLWFPTRVVAVLPAPDWLITCAIAIWLGTAVPGLGALAPGPPRRGSLTAPAAPRPRAPPP